MQTEELIEIMRSPIMHRAANKAARRFTKSPEDIEEYVSDIWMRIAELASGKDEAYYVRQMASAARAAYMRRYRGDGVYNNVNGISESPKSNSIPRNALPLGRGRYLKYKPEKLSSWYYDGEWRDYGLQKEGVQVRTFYEIVVVGD